ncbi:rhomboid family intramembrane serine protease [Massilia aurea]|uniref:rhomboid family intramembrane serine protease n=1 Tax=Massilia aurea TaxID=373040 RepID=UPI00346192F6
MLTTTGRRASLLTSPTLWLIVINIGAWVYLGLQGVDWMSPSPADLTAWGGNLGPYTLTGDWQRLVTSMFLHGGALHLGLNMFMLSQIGPLSEAVWGRTRFTLLYLLSGLFGGLASAWWYSNVAVRSLDGNMLRMALGFAPHFATTVSIGASGALLGASGALLVHALRAGDASKIELKVIFQVVALNIGMGFLMTGTDNAAHIGGALAGIAIGALLMLPGERWRIDRKVQSAIIFTVSLLLLVALVKQPPSAAVMAIAKTLRAAADQP